MKPPSPLRPPRNLSASLPAKEPKRPNILFIYADDSRTRRVGCYPEALPWSEDAEHRCAGEDGRALSRRRISARGACLRARRCSPGGSRTAIESMRMEGKYPGSTYDPKQCPFWPAVLREAGLPDGADRQMAHGHGRGRGAATGTTRSCGTARSIRRTRARTTRSRSRLQWRGAHGRTAIPRTTTRSGRANTSRARIATRTSRGICGCATGASTVRSKPAERHKGMYKDARRADAGGHFSAAPGQARLSQEDAGVGARADGQPYAGKNDAEQVGDERLRRRTGRSRDDPSSSGCGR